MTQIGWTYMSITLVALFGITVYLLYERFRSKHRRS